MSLGRPKDPRIRLTIFIKEDVKKRILAGVRKGVSALNTPGKIVEKFVQGEEVINFKPSTRWLAGTALLSRKEVGLLAETKHKKPFKKGNSKKPKPEKTK